MAINSWIGKYIHTIRYDPAIRMTLQNIDESHKYWEKAARHNFKYNVKFLENSKHSMYSCFLLDYLW